MRLSRCRRISTEDVLAHTSAALTLIQNFSSLAGSVPCLSAVIGSTLSLISAIEKIKDDRERCVHLLGRISALLGDVNRAINVDLSLDSANTSLTVSLIELYSTLDRINADLQEFTHKHSLFRFLYRGSVSTKLQRHTWAIDEVSRSFNRAVLIAILRRLDGQSIFDSRGLRLFRITELGLYRVRGAWKARISRISAREWDGTWEGRAVTVRVLGQEHSVEELLRSLATTSACRHPNIIQLIGRSHPCEPQQFVVLDRSPIKASHYFAKADVPLRLHSYLQMFVDYEDLIAYLRSVQFPVADIDKVYDHDSTCLPSLFVKEDGTLALQAEDLVDADVGCLIHRLCTLFNIDDRPTMTRRANDSDCTESAQALLSFISSHPGQHEISCHLQGCRLDSVDWPDVWCYSWFQSPVSVEVGDYGYMRPQTANFTRLGNISEFIYRDAFQWHTRAYVDNTPTEYEYLVGWSSRTWSFDLEPGAFVWRAVANQIKMTVEGEFYWLHAYATAQRHGIDLRYLILVDGVNYRWSIKSKATPDSPFEDQAYFHQLPLTPDRKVPDPFGYWSIGPEAMYTPSPEVSLPEMILGSWYAHLLLAIVTDTTLGILEAKTNIPLEEQKTRPRS
ncbi:hypothetical protein CERSUDRAFT_118746 [Gelatoporia subvermispora B]|uniref:Uncharacterized protein n=1 Tax=Ceriporiopsis subvermispora (strain B) TaxID=914234 RepID=M2Q6D4_CERS8|nr:hypothetical protein CERSUDRAFT_118746 [Gelatoporia subvermispora B]